MASTPGLAAGEVEPSIQEVGLSVVHADPFVADHVGRDDVRDPGEMAPALPGSLIDIAAHESDLGGATPID